MPWVSCTRFLGVILDEAEHWTTNGVWVTAGEADFVPHFFDAEGTSLQEAHDGNRRNLRVLMETCFPSFVTSANAPGQFPIVAAENVFPIMQHLFAGSSILPIPKLLKETMTPVAAAMAMGAAKQYGVRYWTTVDLWSPAGYPGHSPDEVRSALIFSYWTGAESTYVENLAYHDSLYQAKGDQIELSPHGKVVKWFTGEYLPAQTRSVQFAEFSPEVIIVRFEDTDWGQVDRSPWLRRHLYGASNLERDSVTSYWLKIWHVLSHGVIPRTAVNWNGDVSIPFRFFIPANNVAVYDHTASDPELFRTAKLVLLTGKTVSVDCLNTLRDLVEGGLTVVTPPHLAPEGMGSAAAPFAEYRTGQGRWLVTQDITDPAVVRAISPHLGRPDELRYLFGNTEVVFSAPEYPDRIQVTIRPK
jgi:hypothetical protein